MIFSNAGRRIHLTGQILFSFLILFLLSTACSGKSSSGGKEYLVRKIVDGDTIELSNRRRVRYIGIDAPETMRRKLDSWVFDPEDFGIEAKKLNRSLVSGRSVRLEFDVVSEDKYGRWLAYVFVDEIMINLELLKSGYASIYTFPPNIKYFELLLNAQEDAQFNKRGIWGDLEEITPANAKDHIGQYAVVKGIVTNVHVSPKSIFLNFGPYKRKYLTAVIYGSNIQFFSNKGIDPSSDYNGKYLEITGKIKDRNGPRIVIDNPSQIRIISE